MRQLAIVTDLDRCTGCHACSIACKEENRVPLGAFWNRVLQVGPEGTFPDLRMYYLPLACQHCEKPVCTVVCPTGASHRRSDGLVLIDREKCIGCRSCQKACPYEVHAFDQEARKMSKCTLCVELVDAGDRPACVKTCTGGARLFGDLMDPNSGVSRKVRAAGAQAYTLLPGAGTMPSAHYILTRQAFIGRGQKVPVRSGASR